MIRLSDSEVERLLSPAEARQALAAAFRRDWQATVRMPLRTQVELGAGATLLLMPCYDSVLAAAGLKLVTVRSEAAGRGRIQASYLLLDPVSGVLLAHMDADYLTDTRTAAASAVATDALARPDARALGVFGAGRQARAHFHGLREVRSFQRFLVCATTPESSDRAARRLSAELGMTIEPVGPRELVESSDVVCTCTTSSTPVFEGAWLCPGGHLNLVGAFRPAARECDDAAIARARVFVDTYEGALAEAGDLLLPMGRGVIGREHIAGNLHERLSGQRPGRRDRDEITVFKSLGCALEDLAVAALVYSKWSVENERKC